MSNKTKTKKDLIAAISKLYEVIETLDGIGLSIEANQAEDLMNELAHFLSEQIKEEADS